MDGCDTCLFYLLDPVKLGTGLCRRYPPSGVSDRYPTVEADDWCGEYQDTDTAEDPRSSFGEEDPE